jgi:lipoyl(octanoyl) transferase
LTALGWEWRGRMAYATALDAQRTRRQQVLAGTADEVVWLLEHPPVVTTGRRPAPGVPSETVLAAKGVELYAVERGGLATWHGPGQLVAYVIVDAGRRGLGAKGLVAALEEGTIRWLASQGVQCGRRAGHPGVWQGKTKLCALGLHFSRGVSMHGLALNLQPDLAGFGLILPCGIVDGEVGSLQSLSGASPDPAEASKTLGPMLIEAIEAGSSNTIVSTARVDAACASQ